MIISVDLVLEEFLPYEICDTLIRFYDSDSDSEWSKTSEVLYPNHDQYLFTHEVELLTMQTPEDFQEEHVIHDFSTHSEEFQYECIGYFLSDIEEEEDSYDSFEETNFQSGFDVPSFEIPSALVQNISLDAQSFVDKVEYILLFIHDMKKCNTAVDVLVACSHLIKHACKGSLVINELTHFLYDKIIECWSSVDLEVQSGFDDFETIFESHDMINRSEFIRSLRKTMAYVVSFSCYQHLNYDLLSDNGKFEDFSNLLDKNSLKFTGDMMITILKTMKYGIQNFTRFMHTGQIKDIFFSEDNVSRWNDKYAKVILDHKILSNPEPFGVSIETFEEHLNSTIDEGKHMLQCKQVLSKFDVSLIQKRIAELTIMRREYELSKLAQGSRSPPLSILVFGESSVGKSSFLEILYCYFAKISNIHGESLSCSDAFKYTRCAADEYWSQFKSYQWCILLDDIAVKLPSKATDDTTLDEIIRINNTVAWVPPQAELENKGKNPVKPKLFLGSTNVKTMNTSSWFEVPIAIQRRFPYVITLAPKEEFAIRALNGSLMLDQEKARLSSEAGYDNFWKIKVEKVSPGPHAGNLKHRVMAKYDFVLETEDINEFLKWYAEIIKSHNAQNARMIHAVNKYQEVEICAECYGQENKCKCQSILLQSGYLDGAATLHRGYFYVTFFTMILWYLNFARFLLGYLEGIPFAKNFVSFAIMYIIKIENFLLETSARQLSSALEPCKNIVLVISAIIVAITGYKFYSSFTTEKTVELQGNSQSRGKAPSPKNERENVWEWQEPPHITNVDLSRQVMCAQGSISDQISKFSENLFRFKIYTETGKCSEGKALAIGGQLYITSAHFFREFVVKMHITKHSEQGSVPVARTFKIYEGNNLFLDTEKDIAMFCVADLPANKSICNMFFTTKTKTPEMNGFWMHRELDGSVRKQVLKCLKQSRMRMKDSAKDIDMMLDVYETTTPRLTMGGDCGSMALGVLNDKMVVLLGMHAGASIANPNKIYISQVWRDDLEKLMFNFDSMHKVQSGHIRMNDGYGKEIDTIPLHRKSPFNFLPIGGSASLIGGIPARMGLKSRVNKTLLCDELIEATSEDGMFKIVDNMGKPVMNGYEPKHVNLEHMIRTNEETDHEVLSIIEESFFNDIMQDLPEEELELLHTYDLDTAINGSVGVAYVDAMKRSTSAGFPWREVKRKHLVEQEDTDRVKLTPELEKLVQEIEENYLSGHRTNPVYAATFKDEPTSLEKIAIKKTRVFCAAPMDYSVVVRKYMLSLIRVIQRNPIVFETAVGVQAQSVQWEIFYNHIVQHGTHKIIAGDYSKFDKKMAPAFILSAFRVLKRLAAKGNYTSDELRVIDCIAHDTAFPVTDFFGDLVMFHGTNPSGHPLTVIINSIVNSLYMRYAYFMLNPEQNCETFRKNVSLITYGDDNIMSVHDSSPWFNHTKIQIALKRIGVGYTMAEKEMESIPYIDIREASFLKRKFVYNRDIGAIVGPIEHASISKMLTKCVRNNNYVPEQHMLSVFRSALDEYFWYGKKIFENRREKFLMIARSNGLLDYSENINAFPLWEELIQRYNDASEIFLTKE